MAVRMNQQETGGFKLLQEDALDDRPCPAVKKFVSSVLDRKDMKDQEVANSFRNLMEYRDSASSPSACSVATSSSVLDGDRLNSPRSPSSPTTAPGPMDDQRLPNELLDEICEDIGMKEGMELDFVEYLMEQDTNPQLYMTQEAISSGAFNGCCLVLFYYLCVLSLSLFVTGTFVCCHYLCLLPLLLLPVFTFIYCHYLCFVTITFVFGYYLCVLSLPLFVPTPFVLSLCLWIGPPHTQVNHSTQGAFFTKGMYPGGPFQPHHQPQQIRHHPGMGHGHMGHIPGPTDPHHPSVPTPVDSPLDQGYFSNESAGNCSNGSAPSPAFTSSSMSSFSSISTIMPADHSQKTSLIHHQQQQQQQQTAPSGISNSRPSGQKSVHFADLPNGSPPAYTGPSTPSDCAFEMETNGQPKMLPSGKIMPRFHHSMKSGVAPYTVPNNQGQVIGPPVPSGYDMNNRPSCAMSLPGDSSSPGEPMQEYMAKSGHINGSSSSAFYMDGNQNMLRMDSMHDYPSVPPPLISPQPSDYVNLQAEQPHYGMNQFSSMQQQQQSAHSQQSSHPSSSAESMPPLQTHPHLQSSQQQQHHHHHHHHHHDQNHPFSSCSYSTQGMPSELHPPHQNSMQISHDGSSSGYHVPLAVSTPMSSRTGPNTRLGAQYPGQICSPVFEGSYEQSSRPDMYPPQQPHGVMPPSQGVMSSQQASSIQRGWGPEDLRVQVGGMQPNLSPLKGGLQPAHSQGLPHMQPSPTPGCAAPMGPGSHIQDMNMGPSGIHVNPNMGPSQPHMGPHPEYGPCMGISCNFCKMNQAGSQPIPHPHMGPCPSPNCHMCKMNHPCAVPQPATALSHGGPCAGPGCTACKVSQSVRPQMLSSQQKFIQHLIMDEANSAYRSHPLFPLLRDLVIAEMNFDNPRFHYQQLLSLLPHDFHKLLQNFLHRNPPSGHYQSNQAVESVIMDSLRLAHSNLVDKITHRQEMEKMKANSSASLRSMEEFCQKFDHSVTGPMQGRSGPNGAMGLTHPMAGYHEGGYIQHGMSHVYRSMKDGPDVYGEAALGVASPQTNKTESKKHPSLPKEAVAMMMEWLRNHKDNPYPNDDEKAMLIKQTGLSINQINYWFTNARRRILPKWAQCKT
ncbi:unnamed protein product [Candidula unifasciata]|uniref:Homeobox domain-containing protein n=1 Tax=Candidula unifasciata TaxID=100452 RepID=A0A8S3YH03_9EUPU|nr:unnamed protein product [Candidula unifasciata]